ncbi:beta-1,3-glucan-binding protein-like [Periplaneta americana]|uniref:beta-1,3-glucan-binding protein-like n=1 Tax=Periplaneta americana TaxID=6978 RepID=UPI0037E821FB
MLFPAILCFVAAIAASSAQDYIVPDATFQALKPRGLRVSIPDEPGVQLFAFHGNVNKEMNGLEAGQMARDIIKAKNGRWVFQDDRIRLKPGDVIYYWLYVQYEGLGYQKLDQTWTVRELVDPNEGGVPSNTPATPGTPIQTPAPPPPPPPQQTCERTRTLVNGKPACQGQLLFEDNFDSLDNTKWEHDIRIAGSPDYEFVAYTSDSDNCFVNNGILHVKPKLVSESQGEDFVTQGKLDMKGCTGIAGSTDCTKEAIGWDIIPPVFSARLRTRQHFSFCYGQVEIRAKLPSGDWIFPELWLEPKDNWYGREYMSGRFQLAMARGNRELFMADQRQSHIGERRLEAGCFLGVDNKVKKEMKSWEGGFGWCNNFHIYTLTWTPDDMTFKVDGQTIGVLSPPPGGYRNLPAFSGSSDIPWGRGTKLAPFDKEFYLSLGLGVGGVQDFPDNCTTGLPQGGLHPKPWKNTDPKAMLQFWRDKDNWYPTWSGDNSALQVDYVKVWAL